jgi:hypothetical protein
MDRLSTPWPSCHPSYFIPVSTGLRFLTNLRPDIGVSLNLNPAHSVGVKGSEYPSDRSLSEFWPLRGNLTFSEVSAQCVDRRGISKSPVIMRV